MLHLVQTRKGLEKCKQMLQHGDAVVFIGDGVMCAEDLEHGQVFVLDGDADRYGVKMADDRAVYSASKLVELVAEHSQSVSWR